jgi:hypothetical protein
LIACSSARVYPGWMRKPLAVIPTNTDTANTFNRRLSWV